MKIDLGKNGKPAHTLQKKSLTAIKIPSVASGKCRVAAQKRKLKFKNEMLWGYGKIEPWYVKGDRLAKTAKEITAVKVYWNSDDQDLQDDRGEWGESGGAIEVSAWCEEKGITGYKNDFCKSLVRPDHEGARVARSEFAYWEYVPKQLVDHYPWSVLKGVQESEEEKKIRWNENAVLFKVKWTDNVRFLTEQPQGDTWEPAEKIHEFMIDEYFKNLKIDADPEEVELPICDELNNTLLEASYIGEKGKSVHEDSE